MKGFFLGSCLSKMALDKILICFPGCEKKTILEFFFTRPINGQQICTHPIKNSPKSKQSWTNPWNSFNYFKKSPFFCSEFFLEWMTNWRFFFIRFFCLCSYLHVCGGCQMIIIWHHIFISDCILCVITTLLASNKAKNQNRKKTAKRQKYNIYGSISVVKAKGNET